MDAAQMQKEKGNVQQFAAKRRQAP